MTSPYRVAIIGTGFGAKVHLPTWKSIPNVQVIGLYGNNLNETQRLAKKHGIAKVYKTWQKAVSDPEVDIVSIALPHFLHAKVALAAIKNKKAFILEKPCGRNLAETQKIAVAANTYKIPHAVNFELRFVPHFLYAKQLLERGEIGKLRAVDIRLVTGGRARADSPITWSNYKKLGGGVLLNYGSHVLDYVRWLIGEPVRVSARLLMRKQFPKQNKSLDPDAEDTVEMELETSNGLPVRIFITNVVYAGCGQAIEIYGDEGTLCLNNPNLGNFIEGFKLLLTDKTREHMVECKIPKRFGTLTTTQGADGRLPAVCALFADFITELKTGRQMTSKLEDAVAVQRVITAANRSNKTGKWQAVI